MNLFQIIKLNLKDSLQTVISFGNPARNQHSVLLREHSEIREKLLQQNQTILFKETVTYSFIN